MRKVCLDIRMPDVLVHAIMDALLGAAALGDIGKHFPDTDPAYEGADSMRLLEEVRKLLDANNYVIGNVDATVIAQRPKLAPYIDAMRENIAARLQIDKNQVNVKADNRGRSWIYRAGTGNQFPGDLPA